MWRHRNIECVDFAFENDIRWFSEGERTKVWERERKKAVCNFRNYLSFDLRMRHFSAHVNATCTKMSLWNNTHTHTLQIILALLNFLLGELVVLECGNACGCARKCKLEWLTMRWKNPTARNENTEENTESGRYVNKQSAYETKETHGVLQWICVSTSENAKNEFCTLLQLAMAECMTKSNNENGSYVERNAQSNVCFFQHTHTPKASRLGKKNDHVICYL